MEDARTSVEPAPTPEEAAAIVAALAVVRRDEPRARLPVRNRWELAGLLGHPIPVGMKLEGSLWSYLSWGGER